MKIDIVTAAEIFYKYAQAQNQQKTFNDIRNYSILLTQQVTALYDATNEIVTAAQPRIAKPLSIMRPEAKTSAYNIQIASRVLTQKTESQEHKIVEITKQLQIVQKLFNDFEKLYLVPYQSWLTQNSFQDQWKKLDLISRKIKEAITKLNNFLIAAPVTNSTVK